MQLLPAISLRNYIKHYLWVQKPTTVGGQLHIFGDGNPGITFCFNGFLYQDALLQLPLPAIFGYGQISKHRAIYAPESVEMLIVVLQPFALSALLRMPAIELNNMTLNASELLAGADCGDVMRLSKEMPIYARVEALNKLMTKVFYIKPNSNQQIISSTISYIAKMKGRVNSSELVNYTGYGERYLEKQFREHIGISPVRFGKTIRMLSYIKALQAPKKAATLTAQSYQAGFFDQAHLNHDFKKLTGMTPSAFASQREPLALNFFTIRNS